MYRSSTFCGTCSRSETRRKSVSAVPVQRESRFAAPRAAIASSTLAVRKSMLKRVRPLVLGTEECSCAAENIMKPPTGITTRMSGTIAT